MDMIKKKKNKANLEQVSNLRNKTQKSTSVTARTWKSEKDLKM